MGNYMKMRTCEINPSLLVKFSHELAHIMTTYGFILAKQAILSNVKTNFNLT